MRWAEKFAELHAVAESFVGDFDKDKSHQDKLKLCSQPAVPEQAQEASQSYRADERGSFEGAFEQELHYGVETSLSDLQRCSAGWRYRNVPVLAFGVRNWLQKNKGLTDASLVRERRLNQNKPKKRELAAGIDYRAHLTHCKSLVPSPGGENYRLWVASNTGALNQFAVLHRGMDICHDCLIETNYHNYSALSESEQDKLRLSFDFVDYVKVNAASYYEEHPLGAWVSGQLFHPLDVSVNESSCQCVHCEWRLPARSSHIVVDEDVFGFKGPICLCCLDRAPLAATTSEAALFSAYIERFWEWKQKYIDDNDLGTLELQALRFTWDQITPHFPVNWKPLLTILRQFEAPNIYCGVDGGFALMAWPRLRRAIVLKDWGKKGFPLNWEVWTYEEVLETLG